MIINININIMINNLSQLKYQVNKIGVIEKCTYYVHIFLVIIFISSFLINSSIFSNILFFLLKINFNLYVNNFGILQR